MSQISTTVVTLVAIGIISSMPCLKMKLFLPENEILQQTTITWLCEQNNVTKFYIWPYRKKKRYISKKEIGRDWNLKQHLKRQNSVMWLWYIKNYTFGLCPEFLTHSSKKSFGISGVVRVSFMCSLEDWFLGAGLQRDQGMIRGLEFFSSTLTSRVAEFITKGQCFNQSDLHNQASITKPPQKL